MIIHCPYCQKPHLLPETGLPGLKSATHCKGCGKRFIIERSKEGLEAVPEEAASIGAGLTPGSDDTPTATTELLAVDDDSATANDEPGTDTWDGLSPQLSEEAGGNDESGETAKILQAFPQLGNLANEYFSFGKIFTPVDKDYYRSKLNLLKADLLLAASSLLNDKVLKAGEQVVKIARGIAYYPAEIPYANGLLTLPANYYALVCTTRRLLLVNLDSHCRQPSRFIFQVFYDEIAKISRGASGTSLIVKTGSGDKWNFTTVKPSLSRDLVSYIKSRITEPPEEIAEGERTGRQLCPACLTPLDKGLASCPACRARFKSAGEALKRSLLLPGMGEIYLGSYLPGLTVLSGYLLIWLVAIVFIILNLAGGVLGAATLIVIYHLVDGFTARGLGRKGYLVDRRAHHPESSAIPPAPGPDQDGPKV